MPVPLALVWIIKHLAVNIKTLNIQVSKQTRTHASLLKVSVQRKLKDQSPVAQLRSDYF